MRKQFGFLAKPFSFFGEAVFKGGALRETTPMLHGALLSRSRKAGAQVAFSSQIKAKFRSVMIRQ
ncbi:hypothetical protein M2171_006524 [Bradyrhizobium japonicum USDA 38]|uniref:hypothetical protein n=1 Tax=Bradyrhizobium TaxID=374 RepID=UPI000417BBA3|nr:hypothetical protein [Bradyrhizobium japonicum]MCS3897391.1 hypothetical protein [Bradyrhizobium japonicum USDA 38]MCS3949906.1 hypothetical protein [Bradyrhizobium japonicum]